MSALPSSRVDAKRFGRRFEALAAIGATAAGGVDRQALSAADACAQALMVQWGRERGFLALHDAAGNLFLRRPGTLPGEPLVLSGSHLDTQPTGGRFDGVYGVLAALEALEALEDAGLACRRGIEAVAWMNEEGSRFAPGMMGSAVLTGARTLRATLAVTDADGISVEEALRETRSALPALADRPLDTPVCAYVEAHIEQGPVLEREGIPLGVVTGIQGKHTFRVEVRGEAAHAGTAPRRERRDALLAATAMVQAMASEFADAEDIIKFTVGRFDVTPNAPSVVPRRVAFSIDLRHPESQRLQALAARVAQLCDAHRGPCEVQVERLVAADAIAFDAGIRDRIATAAAHLGVPVLSLPSLAGHDAGLVARIAPAGMIFIPCRAGITHHEDEFAEMDHMIAGVRVLADVLHGLAR
ncbi:M20 family metallo-hydrolase [Ramlibacter sp.]|uniref:M20 family metallo-hydrolase n=1 Tax=Ramlibacter sp. TaxID=1917967 RepID=UPI002637C823|nr:M20 family metallo-hydrolase [Ramlibacter sp.]MDB5953457.1 allantoate amidohydrolase [Ramlibacter sp.]